MEIRIVAAFCGVRRQCIVKYPRLDSNSQQFCLREEGTYHHSPKELIFMYKNIDYQSVVMPENFGNLNSPNTVIKDVVWTNVSRLI